MFLISANLFTIVLLEVNGGWSNWGAWGKCSKTCGVGYQQSKRYCNSPRPEYGGKKCTGDKIKTRACSVKSCAGKVHSVNFFSITVVNVFPWVKVYQHKCVFCVVFERTITIGPMF